MTCCNCLKCNFSEIAFSSPSWVHNGSEHWEKVGSNWFSLSNATPSWAKRRIKWSPSEFDGERWSSLQMQQYGIANSQIEIGESVGFFFGPIESTRYYCVLSEKTADSRYVVKFGFCDANGVFEDEDDVKEFDNRFGMQTNPRFGIPIEPGDNNIADGPYLSNPSSTVYLTYAGDGKYRLTWSDYYIGFENAAPGICLRQNGYGYRQFARARVIFEDAIAISDILEVAIIQKGAMPACSLRATCFQQYAVRCADEKGWHDQIGGFTEYDLIQWSDGSMQKVVLNGPLLDSPYTGTFLSQPVGQSSDYYFEFTKDVKQATTVGTTKVVELVTKSFFVHAQMIFWPADCANVIAGTIGQQPFSNPVFYSRRFSTSSTTNGFVGSIPQVPSAAVGTVYAAGVTPPTEPMFAWL